MSDVKWIKIATDIFDDDKILLIETLPEADSIIVIWFKLLCLAGKQNNSGVFLLNDRIAFTDKMLATIFRRKESTVQLALKTFEEFGMIEIVDDVITIPNWGKHQNLDKIEAKTEYMRQYMRDYRAKQKLLASKPNCKTNSKANVSEAEKNREDIDIDNISPPIIPPIKSDGGEDRERSETTFDQFWKAYPKKVGKQDAKKAFYRAIKNNHLSIQTLIEAVERQKKCEQWNRENGRFIPNPSTWLNQGRWDDELQENHGQERKPHQRRTTDPSELHDYDLKELARRAKE